MTRSKTPARSSVPPSISPAQAIPKIQRQLERLDAIAKLHYDDGEVAAWDSTTEAVLNAAFGQPNGEKHETTRDILYAQGGSIYMGMHEHEIQQNHVKRQQKRKALLAAAIEQLRDQAEADGQSVEDEASPERAFGKVVHLLGRFHAVAVQLRHRHDDRETLDVSDEYDVQDLLHALLKVEFDDIRPEEHGPSNAGSNPRMDFLLKREQIVIEVKKTRRGLADKELGEELIVDAARYQTHPDCKILVCFVYDPEHRVKNAAALRSDLARLGNQKFRVEVIVNPMP